MKSQPVWKKLRKKDKRRAALVKALQKVSGRERIEDIRESEDAFEGDCLEYKPRISAWYSDPFLISKKEVAL